MHEAILAFARKHKGKFDGQILEVGSYDVNGTIRSVIPVSCGVDMESGPGVDRVCNVVDLINTFGAGVWDNVVSCDALEHMEDWESALTNMWGVLKHGGLFLLTIANMKKGYHGYPHDYWRWEIDDFKRIFHNNDVLDWFLGGPSQGVLVRKSAALDLTIKPRAVDGNSKLRRPKDGNQ